MKYHRSRANPSQRASSLLELQRFIEIVSYRDTFSDDTRIVS